MKTWIESKDFRMATKNIQTGRMKSASHDFARFVTNNTFQSFSHLSGGFIGKRNGKNFRRMNPLFENKTRNKMNNDTCFSASSAGKNKQRTCGMMNSF